MTYLEAASILELSLLNVNEQSLRRSYRRLCLIWHPDLNSSNKANDMIKKINEANKVLKEYISLQVKFETNTNHHTWQNTTKKQENTKQTSTESDKKIIIPQDWKLLSDEEIKQYILYLIKNINKYSLKYEPHPIYPDMARVVIDDYIEILKLGDLFQICGREIGKDLQETVTQLFQLCMLTYINQKYGEFSNFTNFTQRQR